MFPLDSVQAHTFKGTLMRPVIWSEDETSRLCGEMKSGGTGASHWRGVGEEVVCWLWVELLIIVPGQGAEG